MSLKVKLRVTFMIFIAGWYLVWKVFLSRFKFIRELFGSNGGEKTEEKVKRTRSKLRKD